MAMIISLVTVSIDIAVNLCNALLIKEIKNKYKLYIKISNSNLLLNHISDPL